MEKHDKFDAGLGSFATDDQHTRDAQQPSHSRKPLLPVRDAMHQTALVFLDDPIARRLAVAWVTCGGDDDAWFDAAGLSRSSMDATRIARALKVNGVCRTGGITDPLALQYIQAIIAKPLTAAKTKAAKK